MAMAWLAVASRHASKSEHDQAKEDLSHSDARAARVAGREYWGMCVRENRPGFAEVGNHERELRGGDTSEPIVLECAPGPTTKATRAALQGQT